MPLIYLYGCGGHGRVILDILQHQKAAVAGFVDDHPPSGQTHIQGIPIFTTDTPPPNLDPKGCQWVIAIGNNTIRRQIAQKLAAQGHTFATVIHPSAQIGSRVTIAPGSVIMANTVINCDTQIGQHVIVNTAATIDHDCAIGDFCHIAPGSTLCGHVTVGAGSWLQVGTKVPPGIEIGESVISQPGAILT
ncbi:MAG: acetyltransferase [Leptolyngbyaceae cyanobacterium MO_188.B28]|nr:acetyltransferase [Leptolyngbyaceae cyanobacterium MO_188.B28]